MSPPVSKDWWLAAALSGAALPAMAQLPATTAGVISSMTPGAQITVNGERPAIGSPTLTGQRLETGNDSVVHLLLQDQSAVTLGPNSALTIETFTYDASTQQGALRMNLAQGTLRLVSGHIGKNGTAQLVTPGADINLSGGISIVQTAGGNTSSVFLFGQQMTVTGRNGETQTVLRPGYGIQQQGDTVAPPVVISQAQMRLFVGQLEPTATISTTTSNLVAAELGPLIAQTGQALYQPLQNQEPGALAGSAPAAWSISLASNPSLALETVLGAGRQSPIQS